MKKNMGQVDKIIRVLFAVIVAVLVYMDAISGMTATVLMVIAIILLLTSLLNFCPIYRLFGWSTCKTKE